MGGAGLYGYPADYLLYTVLFLLIVLHTRNFLRSRPKNDTRRKDLVIGNVLVFLSMLSGAAWLAETYLRFAHVETDAFGTSLPARKWFVLHTRLNSLGYRDPEWKPENPPDTHRIAVLGDSFTYGWGIEYEASRFTNQLQERLNADNDSTSYEVLNVAKPGWGTGDKYRALQELLDKIELDEVILAYVPNDIERLIPRTDEFDPTVPPEMTFFNPTASALADYIFHRIVVPRRPSVRNYHDWLAAGFADETIWRNHQQQLYALAQLCGDRNTTFRVMLLPFLRTSGEAYDTLVLHAMLRSFLEANEIPVFDLSALGTTKKPERFFVSWHDPHPNWLAHDIIAQWTYTEWYKPPDP